jgi:hypothetical protein
MLVEIFIGGEYFATKKVCVWLFCALFLFLLSKAHVRTLSLSLSLSLLKNLSLLFYIITSLSLSLSRYFYTLLHQVTALVLLPRLLVKHLTR